LRHALISVADVVAVVAVDCSVVVVVVVVTVGLAKNYFYSFNLSINYILKYYLEQCFSTFLILDTLSWFLTIWQYP